MMPNVFWTYYSRLSDDPSIGNSKALDRFLGREESRVFDNGKADSEYFWTTRETDWTSNPILRLRWAVLENWIWEFLQGKAKIDVEAMRELVETFPKLPPDLPEKLLALSEERKKALTARGTGALVVYRGSLMSREDRSRERQMENNAWHIRETQGRRDQQIGTAPQGMRRPYHYRRKKS